MPTLTAAQRVAAEMARIAGNVADAYSACDAKGAVMPAAADQDSDHLAATINTITGGASNEAAPNYHYQHAYDTSAKIKALQSADTFVFGVISDSHVNTGGNSEANTKLSIRRAAFALEAVGKTVGADFIANLGDNQTENRIDASDNSLASLKYLNRCISGVFDDITSFRIPGNHDQSNAADSISKIYSYIGAYNSFDSPVPNQQSSAYMRGYGYKDFTSKKSRVICLNTSDYGNGYAGGYGMSYTQKQFFMQALDLSAKSDASSWKIILLSHIPLDFPGGDYNTVNDIQAILNAYVNGSAVSITVNSSYASAEGESVSGPLSYNYSGKNSAKIVGNFHGHIHNHCYGRMADNDIVRICAPNTAYNQNASSSSYGNGMYDYPSAFNKILDTYAETAVTFFVVDPVNEEIHAVVYGAGTDRTVSYAAEEPPVEPFEETVADLKTLPRNYWNVSASGSVSSDISLSAGNTSLALCVSTQNAIDVTDRWGNTGNYLMPVPAQATKVTVTCLNSTDYLDKIYFRGIKVNGTSFSRVINTNWQTTFSLTFDLGSVDYLAVMLQRSDGANVDSSFPASNISVVFSNQ